MQATRLIPDIYLRWRHGCGYGIHSPFAYRFIRETLRERLPYYAYPDLCRKLKDSGCNLSPHKVKLIFRVITRFMPERITICGDDNAAIEREIIAAVSRRIALAPSDFLIVNGDSGDAMTKIENLIEAGFIAIFLKTDPKTAQELDRLLSTLDYGMRFDNQHGFVIVTALKHLPRQDFHVKF